MEALPNLSDPFVLIQLRNQYYKSKYYLVLGIFIFCLCIIGILSAIFLYLGSQSTAPRYFVADDVGRLLPDIPLSQLNMSNEALTAWMIDAIQKSNSFDFINYRQQLQDAQKYFTDESWATYMKELKISDNLLALQTRRWVFVAKVVGQPVLLKDGLLEDNTRAMRFEVPMLVTYLKPPLYDASNSSSSAFVVTIIVIRRNLLESYQGLAISSMVIQNAPDTIRKISTPLSG